MAPLSQRLTRLDRFGVPGRAGAAAALTGLLIATHLALAWLSPWLQAGAFFLDVIVESPVRPVTWFSADPVVRETELGRLTLPGDVDEPAPGIVLALGAIAAEPDDPRVVRLTQGLARVGFAVLHVRSEGLAEGLVRPVEVERLVRAFDALAALPEVDGESVGFVGLSAGGSLSVAAAAQPGIAERVAFVLAIGPYYDAATLVAATVSGEFETPDGELVDWDPEPITERVVRRTLLSTLEPEAAAAVAAGGRPAGETAEAVALLLEGELTYEEALALARSLEGEPQAVLRGISPRFAADRLPAPLYLLHDRNDAFIPWPESVRLAADVEPEVFHLIDLFEHVEPRAGAIDDLLRDGWRLLRIFARLIDETDA